MLETIGKIPELDSIKERYKQLEELENEINLEYSMLEKLKKHEFYIALNKTYREKTFKDFESIIKQCTNLIIELVKMIENQEKQSNQKLM